MLTIPPPMSNVERQRQFRERNPGYFRKYYARKRSIAKHVSARMLAEAQAALAAARGAATIATLAKPEPLMLPAPVQDSAMAAIHALAAALVSPSAREMVPRAAPSPRSTGAN